MYKSAFLIVSGQVDSDIGKNSVFTPINAVAMLYTCKGHVRACPLLYGYIRFWANNAGTPHVPIGTVDKGLTFLPSLTGARKSARGSFLEDVLPYGHKLRATSDFFGGKSVSGQYEIRGM